MKTRGFKPSLFLSVPLAESGERNASAKTAPGIYCDLKAQKPFQETELQRETRIARVWKRAYEDAIDRIAPRNVANMALFGFSIGVAGCCIFAMVANGQIYFDLAYLTILSAWGAKHFGDAWQKTQTEYGEADRKLQKTLKRLNQLNRGIIPTDAPNQ